MSEHNNANTAKVAGRRELWFDSIPECLDEVNRISAADLRGELATIGNWTPGQVLSHVANWIEYGYDGYPLGPPPFFVRWILKMGVRKILAKGMKPGVKIPGISGGTLGAEPMDTQDAAVKLQAAFKRLESGEQAKYDSPAFGKMSHEDRIRLNLRHAELHLSFLKY